MTLAEQPAPPELVVDAAVQPPEGDPLWYKDAIIYETHVRAFADSGADGVGDFRGLTEKLDYLLDLGITAIWLLPFYPSPLRDDGYDIADYTSVNPDYGTLRDVRTFIREAHRRGLRVITELVCNHTSDQHPWFQRARRAPKGSAARDFYVWSDTPDRYLDARIIFKDTEQSNWAWDPIAGQYFWHRFFSHQPDLNFENEKVQQVLIRAMEFWLDLGVDGLRLDAVPYLYEREGTNCENLPETHAFLRKLRAHIDSRYSERMLLAEANQWPEDSVQYFGNGDECHMAFHFPVMPRMFMAVRMEDRFPIYDILGQTPPIPETAQWALFLRNHDELTLEMVTDEERDYMYRVYANDPQMRINLGIRRRLAPLLGNNRRRIELMNGLLFSLPGTPVLYYGDEIGMGDNVYLGDRNGVRTPMQWSGDRNAGFSQANRQALYFPVITDPEYHFEAINVQVQQGNPQSLLWWMKRLIALRRQHPAFGRGTLEFLHPENRKVLAFIRRYGDEQILVVANLSRFSQPCELDLSALAGIVPIEMFGRVEFPAIGTLPYFLTIAPHGFFWFLLRAPAADVVAAAEAEPPTLKVVDDWQEVLSGRALTALTAALPAWIRTRRWFRSKARDIRRVRLRESVTVPLDEREAALAFFEVEYIDGDPETYAVPLTYAPGEDGERILRDHPGAGIARLQPTGMLSPGVLYDAFVDPLFSSTLLEAIGAKRRFRGRSGELAASPTRQFRRLRGPAAEALQPVPTRTEQTNSSAVLGDRLILKVFRQIEEGINPDLEVTRFLTDRAFPNVPAVAGWIAYRGGSAEREPSALAILQEFVPNKGDLWTYTLDQVEDYLDRAAAAPDRAAAVDTSTRSLLALSAQEPAPAAQLMIGTFLDTAWLLGKRTGELHGALASEPDDPEFAPQPFAPLDQRSLYQSLRNGARQTFAMLSRRIGRLPDAAQADARRVLDAEAQVEARYRALLDAKLTARRIRVHGDFHAGQVLWTGRDVVIIDFEGEPARPLSERRRKRSALVDVAGMIRSFHYAAYGALLSPTGAGPARPGDPAALEPWLAFWYVHVAAAFLRGYREGAGDGVFVPRADEEMARLLDAFLLEKAIYEVGYEMNNRPDWVSIPLRGIAELLSS